MKKLAIWGALLSTALSVIVLVLVFGLDPTVEASPPHKPLKCAGYMIEVDVSVVPYGEKILKVTPPPWGPPISTDHVLVGSPGSDLIEVTSDGQPWLLVGLGGDDTLRGGDGDDAICGYDGNDVVMGGPGNDILRGGNGCDHLNGEAGNDTLDGGPGNDSGLDERGLGAGCVNAGFGNDQLGGLWGHEGDDTLRGGRGRDYLSGGNGAFELNAETGKLEDHHKDDCDGGPGIDEVEGLAEGNPDCENTKFIP